MTGILYFSDIYYGWIMQLQHGWEFLNTPILKAIENIPTAGLFEAVTDIWKIFVVATGFSNLTVLEFMFAMSGVGFGIYLLISLVKWANVIA